MSREAQYRQACQRLNAEEYVLTTVLQKEKNNAEKIVNLIKSCAYGILVRQSVEYIVNGKLEKAYRYNHAFLSELKEKELIEKIDMLKKAQSTQQKTSAIEIETYHRTRKFANIIAHAEYFDAYESEFDKFRSKYPRKDGHGTRDGCELLKQYIDKYLGENAYENNWYLRQLRQNIEDFNFFDVYEFLYDEKNKLAYVLLAGLLIRHCMEHFVEVSLLKNESLYPPPEDGKTPRLSTKIKALGKEYETRALHRVSEDTNTVIHVGDINEKNTGNYIAETEISLLSAYDRLLEVRQAGLQRKQRVYNNKSQNNYSYHAPQPARLSKWQRIKPFMVPIIIGSAVLYFLFFTIFYLSFGTYINEFGDRIIDFLDEMIKQLF